MSRASQTTIDRAGRIVVPKPVREAAGLVPGMRLRVSFRDGHIEIEPAPRDVRLERRGPVLVAVAVEESEPLTEEAVRASTVALRSEHGDP